MKACITVWLAGLTMGLSLHAQTPTLDDLYACFSFDTGPVSDYPAGTDTVAFTMANLNLQPARFDSGLAPLSKIAESTAIRDLMAPVAGAWSLSFWFKTGADGTWYSTAANRLPYTWPAKNAGVATGITATDDQKSFRYLLSCGALANQDGKTGWNAGWSLRVNKDKSVTCDFFNGVNADGSALLSLTVPDAFQAFGDWVQVTLVRTSTTAGDVILYASAPDGQGAYQTRSTRYNGAANAWARALWGGEFRTHEGVCETNGALDDLASWRIALTENDVTALAGTTTHNYLTGLQHNLTPRHLHVYFPFDADTISDLITGAAPVSLATTAAAFAEGRFDNAAATTTTFSDAGAARDLASPLTGPWSLSLWFKTGTEGAWSTTAANRLPHTWPAKNAGTATGITATTEQKSFRYLVSCGALAGEANSHTSWNAGWSLRVNKDKSVTCDFFNGSAAADSALLSLTVPDAFQAFGDWVQVTLVRTATTAGDVILYASAPDGQGAYQTRSTRYNGAANAWARSLWGGEFRAVASIVQQPGGALDDLASWRVALAENEIRTLLDVSTYRRLSGADNPVSRLFTWAAPGGGLFSGENWSLNGASAAFIARGRIRLEDLPGTAETAISLDSGATAHAFSLAASDTAYTLHALPGGSLSARTFTAEVKPGIGADAANGRLTLDGGAYSFDAMNLRDGVLTLTGGATLSTASLTLIDQNRGNMTVNHQNATLNITANSTDLTKNGPFQIGYWGTYDGGQAYGAYNLSGGALTADNACLSLGGDGTKGVFSQSGGTLAVRGIGNNQPGTFTLTGGTLKVGAWGIAANVGALNLGAGTVTAYPGVSWTCSKIPTLTDASAGTTFSAPAGAAITLAGLAGTGSFSVEGNLRLNAPHTLPAGAFIGGGGTLTVTGAFTFADGSGLKKPEEGFLTIAGAVGETTGSIGVTFPESAAGRPLPKEGMAFLAVKGNCALEAGTFAFERPFICKAAVGEESGVATTVFSVFNPRGVCITLY